MDFSLKPTDDCSDKSTADAQADGNLVIDIKAERKCSIIKYHVKEREETDLKSSHFISSLLEKKASLIVPSEWAVFPQRHLNTSSIGSWRGVLSCFFPSKEEESLSAALL